MLHSTEYKLTSPSAPMRAMSRGRVVTHATPHRKATVHARSVKMLNRMDRTLVMIPKTAATGTDGTRDASMMGVVIAQWRCRSHHMRVTGDSHTNVARMDSHTMAMMME